MSLPDLTMAAGASVLTPALRRLMGCLGSGTAWVDSSGRIGSWSPAMAHLTGREIDDARPTVEEAFFSLMPEPAERERLLETLDSILQGRTNSAFVLEASVETRHGAMRRLELEILPLSPEDGGGALILGRDETGHVSARRDLETLLRCSSDGIFVINRNSQITLFNDACVRITGYRPEEVLYQTGVCQRIFQCPQDGAEALHPALCRGEAVFEGSETVAPTELVIRNRDGRPLWVECSYSPIRGPGGEVQYFIGIFRDISERKRLEDQLLVSQKLATLGELIGGLAHEIRNPLGIIRSAADIVSNDQRPVEQRREAVQFIKEEAARLDGTIKALLNLVRPARAEDHPVELNTLLIQAVAIYTPLHDSFQIERRLAPDLPRVCASREALQTVFLNLILNADQAMASGGSLIIETERAPGGVRIRFRDSGPGIEPSLLEKVFQPFVTTKKSGIGLGLSLAAHVVEAHKGCIHAENQASGGACFTIDLPAAAESFAG